MWRSDQKVWRPCNLVDSFLYILFVNQWFPVTAFLEAATHSKSKSAPRKSIYLQIGQDMRLKAELALRKAGLHKSDYARQILSAMQPPTQPRRDADSSAFQALFSAASTWPDLPISCRQKLSMRITVFVTSGRDFPATMVSDLTLSFR